MSSNADDVRTERVLRLVVHTLLAVVLAPLLWRSGLRLPSAELAAYAGAVVAYGVWMVYGADWLKRVLPIVPPAVYMAVVLALFALVFHLPLESPNQWLLMMPAIGTAAFMFRPLGMVLTGTVLLAILYWDLRSAGRSALADLESLSQVAVGLGFTAACSVLAKRANDSRAEAERLAGELASANAELRAANARTAELSAAEERNRIARDIHDGLGHYLTVVAVQTQAALALLPTQPDRATAALAKAEQSARAALADVRRSVGALRSTGGIPTLREAIEGLVHESGLAAQFLCRGEPRTMGEAAEQALFRVAQEGLTNVRKHAGPAQATVTLDFQDAARVVVEVADDGAGARAPAGGGGFGLAGLRERLETAGGSLTAGPEAQGGFRVRAEVLA